MNRSKWKGFLIHSRLLKKKVFKQSLISLWSKNFNLPQTVNNKKLAVYCGKKFKKIFVTTPKLNFKIGEFCITRSKFSHKNKDKIVNPLKKNVKPKPKKKN